jgi:hypothetical protein
MKNALKRDISIILVVTIITLANIQTLATTKPSDITIKMNGIIINLNVKPRMINGRILVPVASLSKELGATSEWVANTKSVVITLPEKDKTKIIYFKIGQASALVDGIEVKLDAAAAIYQNRTYIPLRFVSENFGAVVKWDGKTKTVNITYTLPVKDKPPILPPPWELPEFRTTGSVITTDNNYD